MVWREFNWLPEQPVRELLLASSYLCAGEARVLADIFGVEAAISISGATVMASRAPAAGGAQTLAERSAPADSRNFIASRLADLP